jgi:hypothetical protein
MTYLSLSDSLSDRTIKNDLLIRESFPSWEVFLVWERSVSTGVCLVVMDLPTKEYMGPVCDIISIMLNRFELDTHLPNLVWCDACVCVCMADSLSSGFSLFCSENGK